MWSTGWPLLTCWNVKTSDLGHRNWGKQFRADLRQALAPFGLVKEVRGLGLLSGIEFRAPQKLSLRALYEAFHRIHPAMFGQIMVMRMFRGKNIFTQVCGNNIYGAEGGPAACCYE